MISRESPEKRSAKTIQGLNATLFHRSAASQDLPFRKEIEPFSLHVTQHLRHFHQYIGRSDHPFLKYCIKRLTIDSPQNFL
jgi:hypothetical protein